MVRAHRTGAIDFSNVNVRDRWWWRRFRWTLNDIERELIQRGQLAQHNHWVTTFANAKLDNEGFELSRDRAKEALTAYMASLFPWQSQVLTTAGHDGGAADTMTAYREEFGYPGDPRYAAMLAESLAAFKAAAAGT